MGRQLPHLPQRGQIGAEPLGLALGPQLADEPFRTVRVPPVREDAVPATDELEGDVAAEPRGGSVIRMVDVAPP